MPFFSFVGFLFVFLIFSLPVSRVDHLSSDLINTAIDIYLFPVVFKTLYRHRFLRMFVRVIFYNLFRDLGCLPKRHHFICHLCEALVVAGDSGMSKDSLYSHWQNCFCLFLNSEAVF